MFRNSEIITNKKTSNKMNYELNSIQHNSIITCRGFCFYKLGKYRF
jgi:hypothetical protein